MDIQKFLVWLTEEKKMSRRSARDVLSRCGRVYRMLEIDHLDNNSLAKLLENQAFQDSSMFVKSQLKRTITLCLEFMRKEEKE